MSRLILFLGIALIVLGGLGMVFGLIGAPILIANTASQLTEPTAADLCKPGEQLVKEQGGESYSPGLGYSHSVSYYCVNDAGTRREVTLEAAKNFVSGFLPSLGTLVIPILASGLCFIGVALTILGAIFSRRRRISTAQVVYAGVPTPVPSARFEFPTAPQVPDDLAAKLRQLDEAHQAGLITDEEYQLKRTQLLDGLK